MADEETDRRITDGMPFGCLFAALLALAMGFVILLGTVLGDCAPGDPCHADDGLALLKDAAIVAPIALAGGVAIWLVSMAFIRLVQPRLPKRSINAVLGGFALLAAALAFAPALKLYFRIIGVE